VTAIASLDVSLLNLVAHEMRAPLAVIKGYLSMLGEESSSEPELREALRAMASKAEELEALAGTLITAAQLESADVPHQPALFDIAEAVAMAVESIAARARLEHAAVQVYPAPAPVWVHADRQHVVRVLSNLLNNALTYSSAPAQVAVEVRQATPVEIAVHDRGAGIPVERQGRIFERFSRFAAGGPSRAAGLGLGLSISRDLAELNGGELLLEWSAPGEGSVFVLRLPLASR
jgi:two-component system, OmpR family, phosphate regulon sensor histidine kinase PhoR